MKVAHLMSGKEIVKPDAPIADQLDRLWQFMSCIPDTPRTPAIVTVKRLTNGKPAMHETNFAISMFPNYWVKKS